MLIITRLLSLLALLLIGLAPAHAAKQPGIALSDDQQQSVRAVSDYMNSFTTLRGEFSQISPKGNVSKGVFIISKPGRMRFEYAAPNPFIIVSDGTWVTIKNRAKEKGDQFPLSATPLRLVLNKNVNLLAEAAILGIEKAEGLTTITLQDRKSKIGGSLILVFDENRNELQQWVVIDGKGRRTTVTLANIETGVKVDPKWFKIKINRQERDPK